MHRMDGEGWIQIKATEQKALTALRTRAPSRVLNNRNVEDPFTNVNMRGYDLTTQEGGLPIIVNGQLIGAIGVGGGPQEEQCAYQALTKVLGPQPPGNMPQPGRGASAPGAVTAPPAAR